ncbi:hypothetical protein CH063_01169 [Colletotrichum higginsianum]|uniref:Uncharacterized protein n=2 Tax=Colletotrichum higginsianum TaxID=80884 RepID=H1V2Z5_COLHI|nr:uncharacterized protein CH63R_10599 [Colletotrichum higginsianum IMI 349063]OBR06479.1 hypothetical protein CH63R_10599 [Colletotrichum higginsianum IMI 349063]TIC97679.1 hypothetical protein CH35J_007401 [Colletotrichum higginsianum]CCF34597.1 hypothetical protein CH063_01169 [Colletotrichum higginsianum]
MLRNSKLLLLFSLLWIAIAHEGESRPALSHFSLRRAVPNEVQYCSLETCGDRERAGLCRRQLSPRVLEAPDPSSHPASGHWYGPNNYGNSVDSFFRGEIAKRADTQSDIVSIYGGQVTSEYVRFKDEPRSLAMLGLCGCIGLIVMSRSAVWMAHVYEHPVLTNDDTFDENGIAVLYNGRGSSDMYYGLSDLSGNVFAPDEDPVAVVFAPKSSSSGFQYEPLMRKIDQMVERSIGIDPKWVGYVPRRTGGVISRFDFDCTRSEGKVLVQYQPSNPGRFTRSKAKARIWVEGDSWTYKTSWSPQSDQKRY